MTLDEGRRLSEVVLGRVLGLPGQTAESLEGCFDEGLAELVRVHSRRRLKSIGEHVEQGVTGCCFTGLVTGGQRDG